MSDAQDNPLRQDPPASPGSDDSFSSDASDASESTRFRRRLRVVSRRYGLPDYRSEVTQKYVKRGYKLLCKNALALVLFLCACAAGYKLMMMAESGEIYALWATAVRTHLQFSVIQVASYFAVLAFAVAAFLFNSKQPVYLVDFCVLKPPKDWRVTAGKLEEIIRSRLSRKDADEQVHFQIERILKTSGLDNEGTYLPPGITSCKPPNLEDARGEARVVIFGLVRDLLKRTGLSPKDVDILIVNCSLFSPTPSLSAMIVNHFKMRTNIQSYNLGGMGCSAGVVSLQLAKDLLQTYKGANALVVSTENITQNFFPGVTKSMVIPNMLFRVGGAAVLLSNKRMDSWRAKYKLLHCVRSHRGSQDDAFSCVYQQEDDRGNMGVKLDRSLMAVAGQALKVNITTLGPLVLPFTEQAKFLINLVRRKGLKAKIPAYIPDFKTAFDHFCIHAGGRGVIDAIQENLHLNANLVEPSRKTLYHYGNTSSSSIWYELAWSETNGGVHYGARVWQIAFGSGFKCNSAVWQALRNNTKPHEAWVDP